MKKFASMVISLTMVATISGCSAQNGEARSVTTGNTTTTAVTTTTTATTTTPAVTTTAPAVTTEETTTTTQVTTTETETTTEAPSRPDVEVTSTKKAKLVVNKENGIVSLNVKKVSQHPEFNKGTSIASAITVLNYYGFGCTKTELLQYLPISETADENGLWEDPEEYFLGDPTGEDMEYCSTSVLKKAITSYFEAQNISDYEVVDLGGSELADLHAEIDAGNPVIIWTGVGMFYLRMGNQDLPLKNGGKFNYTPINQCMVLVGYEANGSVLVANTLTSEKENEEYIEAQATDSYNMMGKQAIVIHKK